MGRGRRVGLAASHQLNLGTFQGSTWHLRPEWKLPWTHGGGRQGCLCWKRGVVGNLSPGLLGVAVREAPRP